MKSKSKRFLVETVSKNFFLSLFSPKLSKSCDFQHGSIVGRIFFVQTNEASREKSDFFALSLPSYFWWRQGNIVIPEIPLWRKRVHFKSKSYKVIYHTVMLLGIGLDKRWIHMAMNHRPACLWLTGLVPRN